MIVNLLLFAAAKEIAGTDQIEIEIGENCTVEQLKTALVLKYPDLAALTKRSTFAVEQAFANDQTQIYANSEVALIPPVSGG